MKLPRDAYLPALLAALGAAELVSTRFSSWGWGLALELVACLALVFRRRWTVVAPVAACCLGMFLPLVDDELSEPAAPVAIAIAALYAMARWNPRRPATIAVLVSLVPAVLYTVLVDESGVDPTNFVFILVILTPPVAMGRVLRRMAEQAEQLEAQQEAVRRDAIRTERDRIARDLHDVIAHSLSAMVVQTAAAEDLVGSDPKRAKELLASVAETGRAALAETGRLLHVIRDDSDELGLAPAPGLDDLGVLLERFRDSGLAVDATIAADLPGLSAGADVSAYRVVQEALTNALKHAPDHKAALRVEAHGEGVVIRASNWSDGRRGQGSGLGLLGMRERLALVGGTLTAEVTPEGRFDVVATLPGGGL